MASGTNDGFTCIKRKSFIGLSRNLGQCHISAKLTLSIKGLSTFPNVLAELSYKMMSYVFGVGKGKDKQRLYQLSRFYELSHPEIWNLGIGTAFQSKGDK